MKSESAASPKEQGLVPRVPAYRRIEEDIRSRVRDGRLPPGTMLANRHNLAREYGVSLSTTQQAVANLIAAGVLETFDRRGTFVTRAQHPHDSHGPRAGDDGGLRRAMGAQGVREPQPPASTGLTAATLGIVATARIANAASSDVGSLWARLAIRSLEHVFSAAGGTTRFFDRYPEGRGAASRPWDDAHAISIPQAIAALREEGADAIAVVGLCDAVDMSGEVVSAVDVETIPTVYISWHEVQPPLAQVYYDNRFAGFQAAQHLLRQGYQQLIFLAPFTDAWLTERVQGAQSAVRQAGLLDDALCFYPSGSLAESYDRLVSSACVYDLAQTAFAQGWEALCPGSEGPYGIIAPNDDTAYAVLDAASKHGQEAGVDFGLIGFDDDPRSYVVGLTTVRPPVEAMGEEAGLLLLRALAGDKQGQGMRLRSHLISRASTCLYPR